MKKTKGLSLVCLISVYFFALQKSAAAPPLLAAIINSVLLPNIIVCLASTSLLFLKKVRERALLFLFISGILLGIFFLPQFYRTRLLYFITVYATTMLSIVASAFILFQAPRWLTKLPKANALKPIFIISCLLLVFIFWAPFIFVSIKTIIMLIIFAILILYMATPLFSSSLPAKFLIYRICITILFLAAFLAWLYIFPLHKNIVFFPPAASIQRITQYLHFWPVRSSPALSFSGETLLEKYYNDQFASPRELPPAISIEFMTIFKDLNTLSAEDFSKFSHRIYVKSVFPLYNFFVTETTHTLPLNAFGLFSVRTIAKKFSLNKNSRVLFYCGTGIDSAALAIRFHQAGYNKVYCTRVYPIYLAPKTEHTYLIWEKGKNKNNFHKILDYFK